jgi:hypothetical protein
MSLSIRLTGSLAIFCFAYDDSNPISRGIPKKYFHDLQLLYRVKFGGLKIARGNGGRYDFFRAK